MKRIKFIAFLIAFLGLFSGCVGIVTKHEYNKNDLRFIAKESAMIGLSYVFNKNHKLKQIANHSYGFLNLAKSYDLNASIYKPPKKGVLDDTSDN